MFGEKKAAFFIEGKEAFRCYHKSHAQGDYMPVNFDLLLPELEEFSMPDVPFRVVDPTELPERTLEAFNAYMRGSAAPHPTYVYSHDYSRFCMLVRRGDITIT